MQLVLGIIKNRKKIIYFQTILFFTFALSTFLLGGFSGTIANIISAIRNILSYNEKLTKKIIILIILISTILTLAFNNLGFLGLLPLFNTIIYTIFINEKNPLKFKIIFIITVALWLIYDITIKSYASAISDFVTIIGASFVAYRIYKSNTSTLTEE